MKNIPNLFGIILAGGSGGRLWPLSREMYPKQLLKFTNENTLFQAAYLRLNKLIESKNIFTVTNLKHFSDIEMQLKELSAPVDNAIIEPIDRNTAPAIILSVFYILKKACKDNDNPLFLIAPSDHVIQDNESFTELLEQGAKLAEKDYIATFGIKPDKPDTGYGYIDARRDETLSNIISTARRVHLFKEKPDMETAEEYCRKGSFYWNSGIIIFKASVFIQEVKKYAPEILNIIQNSIFTDIVPAVMFNDYVKMPDISADYAILEKSKKMALLPMTCGWNDMGSWQAIYDSGNKCDSNNLITGNVIDFDSKNSLILSNSKLVSTIGLKNTIIVETEDAILACDKNKTHDVAKVFDILRQNNDLACKTHRTTYKVWGYSKILQKEDDVLVKTLYINPKSKFSRHLHNHRSEHWVILSGKAKVVKEDKEYILNAGDSIDIPSKTKHSLENAEDTILKIIEIQNGSVLEEEDVIRFDESCQYL